MLVPRGIARRAAWCRCTSGCQRARSGFSWSPAVHTRAHSCAQGALLRTRRNLNVCEAGRVATKRRGLDFVNRCWSLGDSPYGLPARSRLGTRPEPSIGLLEGAFLISGF